MGSRDVVCPVETEHRSATAVTPHGQARTSAGMWIGTYLHAARYVRSTTVSFVRANKGMVWYAVFKRARNNA